MSLDEMLNKLRWNVKMSLDEMFDEFRWNIWWNCMK